VDLRCWQRLGCAHHCSRRLNNAAVLTLVVSALLVGEFFAQNTSGNPTQDNHANQWSFSLATYGYLVPRDDAYASPIFTADRGWLHLEARYNYENQETGSLWLGYNFVVGNEVIFNATPIVGAVFGKTNGIAPGCELSLACKRIKLSSEIEYLIHTGLCETH